MRENLKTFGEKEMRVIFTGQSGLSSKMMMSNFINFASERLGKRPSYYALEQEMRKSYANKINKEPTEIKLTELFKKPVPIIYDFWTEAFENILKDIDENNAENIYLKLHACFYILNTREFLSPILISKVRNFNADLVITFIDDIHDIHLRLRAENKIFDPEKSRRIEIFRDLIDFRRLLDWRSKEVLLARQLARELGVQHYVFAVKHNRKTLFDLIHTNEFHKVYISHPISEVRRLLLQQNIQTAEEIIDSIEEIENETSGNFVGFFPTTIDEFRIETSGTQKKIFLPRLLPRWKEEKYTHHPTNFLFIKPKDECPPVKFWTDYLDPANEPSKELTMLIESVADEIQQQITTRDHKLVEQSQALLVFRPFFNGNPSRGVRTEIDYHFELKGELPKPCFVYCPKNDQNLLLINFVREEIISTLLKEYSFDLNFAVSITEQFKFTREEIKQLLLSIEDNSLMSKLQSVLREKQTVFTEKGRAMEGDDFLEQDLMLQEIIDSAKRRWQTWIEKYRSASTEWEDQNNLPVKDLVSKANKHFQDKLVRVERKATNKEAKDVKIK